MTHVPIRAYVNTLAICLALGFATIIVILDHKNGEATSVAFKAAEAKGIQHNGLIERMREMSGTYITRGNLYSALLAAGVCATIYAAFLKP
jgi:hypothetical protein